MSSNKRAWILAYAIPIILLNFSLLMEVFGPFLDSIGGQFGLIIYVIGMYILNVVTFKIFGLYFVALNAFFIYKTWHSILNFSVIKNRYGSLFIYCLIVGVVIPIFGVLVVFLYLGNKAGTANYITQSFLLFYFLGSIAMTIFLAHLPYKTIFKNTNKTSPVSVFSFKKIIVLLISSISSCILPFTLFGGLWKDAYQSLLHTISISSLSETKKKDVLEQESFFKKPLIFTNEIVLRDEPKPSIVWIDNNRFLLTAFQDLDANKFLVNIQNSSIKKIPLEDGSYLHQYRICFDGNNLKSIFQQRFGITWTGEDFQNKEIKDLLSSGDQKYTLNFADLDEYNCKKWKDMNNPLKFLQSKGVKVSNAIIVPGNDSRGKYFTGGYAVQETDMYYARWFSSSGEEKEQKILYRPWYADRYSAGLSGMYVDTKFIPVKNGYMVRDRNMNAVYLIKNDNTYTKIIEGNVIGLDFVVDGDNYLRIEDGFYITTSVSPNGCHVAFGFQKPQDPYLSKVEPAKDFILTVLNICQE